MLQLNIQIQTFTSLTPKINTFYSSLHRKRKTPALLFHYHHHRYYSYLFYCSSSCSFFVATKNYSSVLLSVLGNSRSCTSSCSRMRAPHLVGYLVARTTRYEVDADPLSQPRRYTPVDLGHTARKKNKMSIKCRLFFLSTSNYLQDLEF